MQSKKCFDFSVVIWYHIVEKSHVLKRGHFVMYDKNVPRKSKKGGEKTEFEPAKIEIIVFNGEDIITASSDEDCIELVEYLN